MDVLVVKNHGAPRVTRATSADPDCNPILPGSLSNSLTISGSPKLGSPRLMRRAPTIDTSDIDREEREVRCVCVLFAHPDQLCIMFL